MMGALGRFFGGVGSVFDVVRKVMHFIVLIVLFSMLLVLFSGGGGPKGQLSGALMINPDGPLVEQLAGDPVDRAFAELQGGPSAGVRVRDVVAAIDRAADDDRINSIVLRLGGLTGGGITKLQIVADALMRFRQSGKKVYAYGDYFTQSQFFLAAHADEVYSHPSGSVVLDGYGRFRSYYREAIEKLQIDWNVFKVGEYKSFVEPYLRDDMSEQDRTSSSVWLGQLWSAYQTDVAAARGLTPNAIEMYTDTLSAGLASNGGDLAALALEAGLVDGLWNRDQFRSHMVGIAGRDEKRNSYSFTTLNDYLMLNGLTGPDVSSGESAVAVIVASGQILDGVQPSGTIGGDSLAKMIRDAAAKPELKALVLQIDSGGGSKFASEVIQRELMAWQRSGRPLVAAMSSVAASGGYWIAMDADKIFASPSTITGSIGIGGFFPTFQRTLDRLGVHVDGVGTTRYSGAFRPDREMNEETKSVIQMGTEYGYQQFITSVATARDMSVDDVDKIARGRVWSGLDAHRLGLVDELGTLDDAITAAAELADLGDSYGVRYVEKPLTVKEQFAMMFAAKADVWFGDEIRAASDRGSWRQIRDTFGLTRLQQELTALARFNDPHGVYAYCFCRVD
ncbi:MAG: signal peptide peptidase SppA [Gammaproteobacteria bacterium]